MDIFDRLPDDLQHNVLINITYPQNSDLLEDIRDFKKSKEAIINSYLSNGYCSNEDYNHNFNAFSWIENDLMRYWNDEISYINGISDNNYQKMSRLLAYRIKSNIDKDKALQKFHFTKGFPKHRINVYIGCLSVDERREFCNRCRVI
jgi:hypothetical protein